jgi:hypothetical protein
MIEIIRLSSNKQNEKIKHTNCNFSIYYKIIEVWEKDQLLHDKLRSWNFKALFDKK